MDTCIFKILFVTVLVNTLHGCIYKEFKVAETLTNFNTDKEEYQELYFLSKYNNDMKSQNFVDSVICSCLPEIQKKYNNYSIFVYKKTKLANSKRFSKDPDLINSIEVNTGEKSAINDLIQMVGYGHKMGYKMYNHKMKFSCDTTFHRKIY